MLQAMMLRLMATSHSWRLMWVTCLQEWYVAAVVAVVMRRRRSISFSKSTNPQMGKNLSRFFLLLCRFIAGMKRMKSLFW